MENLKEWALGVLGVVGTSEADMLTPTSAALRFAVDVIEEVNHTRYVDEETLTGMFLGALLSQLPWTTLAFSAPGDRPQAAYWAHYSKYGRDAFSESRLGADFALVLPHIGGMVKVAVFQAKRELADSRNRIDIGQSRKKEGEPAVKQYDLLRRYGALIEKTLSLNAGHRPRESLNWIHYVGYMFNGILVRPMSSMTSFQPSVALKDYVAVPMTGFVMQLFELLTMSTVESENGFFGWLPMTILEAQSVLPQLLELSDIYFMGDESLGPRPEFTTLMEFRRSVQVFAAAPAPFKIFPPDPKPVVELPAVRRRRRM